MNRDFFCHDSRQKDHESRHDFFGFSLKKINSRFETLLDVLTQLSDCRQESVEKMERRIWGVSYLYWFWSSGTTFTAYCCFPGMSLQRVFVLWVFVCSVNFSLFSGYHAEGYYAPPIPYGYHAEGYHARTDTFKLTGYHVCRVTTPELPRSIQTSGYRRGITPAGSF